MMHTGLSHFAGRGLPTIWSVVSSSQAHIANRTVFPFTDRDNQVIKEWAGNLDDWLLSSNRPGDNGFDGVQIRRQYILHRLFVLSIYHPARGFDPFNDSVASSEHRELLLSARATLTLRRDDPGIWANWDLVMITWAAILVLQGAEHGVCELGDILLVQGHIERLQKTKPNNSSLHHLLATRLTSWLERTTIPSGAAIQQPTIDPSWALFHQDTIAIASGPRYQQDQVSEISSFRRPTDSFQSHDTLLQQRQCPEQNQGFEHGEFWDLYGGSASLWPPGLNRLFGNSTFPENRSNFDCESSI